MPPKKKNSSASRSPVKQSPQDYPKLIEKTVPFRRLVQIRNLAVAINSLLEIEDRDRNGDGFYDDAIEHTEDLIAELDKLKAHSEAPTNKKRKKSIVILDDEDEDEDGEDDEQPPSKKAKNTAKDNGTTAAKTTSEAAPSKTAAPKAATKKTAAPKAAAKKTAASKRVIAKADSEGEGDEGNKDTVPAKPRRSARHSPTPRP